MVWNIEVNTSAYTRMYQSFTLICRISTVVAAAFSVKPPSFSSFFDFLGLLLPSLGAAFLFFLSFCSSVCKREASEHQQLTGFNETCQKCFNMQSLRGKSSQLTNQPTWNRLSTSSRCTTILLSTGCFKMPPRGKFSSVVAMFDVDANVC